MTKGQTPIWSQGKSHEYYCFELSMLHNFYLKIFITKMQLITNVCDANATCIKCTKVMNMSWECSTPKKHSCLLETRASFFAASYSTSILIITSSGFHFISSFGRSFPSTRFEIAFLVAKITCDMKTSATGI